MSARLNTFVAQVEAAVAADLPEPALLQQVSAALRQLVSQDDWLPATHAAADPTRYQQYLLYLDPAGRFSVVSFVWGPGQHTPVHDHTVWGVIGLLRGQEVSQAYRLEQGELHETGAPDVLRPGDVALVSPRIGDIHRVKNGLDDSVSISIHVYGTDIGTRRRHVFDPQTHAVKAFISGYSATAPATTPARLCPMNKTPVVLRVAQSVAWLTLDRPERGNACSAALVQALDQAIDGAVQSGARVLVLQGNGRHFCTGFDLSQLDEETDDSLLARFTRLELLLQRVARAPLLTVAIAQGRTIGAGADLFTACDVRIACANAGFAFPGARGFGIVLGSRRLAARVGDALATDWIGNAPAIDATHASVTGLATHMAADPAEAIALVEALAADWHSALGVDPATLRAALEPRASEHDAHDLERLVRSAARPGLRERIALYAGLRTAKTNSTDRH